MAVTAEEALLAHGLPAYTLERAYALLKLKCRERGFSVYHVREADDFFGQGFRLHIALPCEIAELEEATEMLLALVSFIAKDEGFCFRMSEVEHLPSGLKSMYVKFHDKHDK